MNHEEEVTLKVRTLASTTRLDVYLSTAMEGLTRKQAQRMIQYGFILVDDRPASKGLSLQGGETIRIVQPIEPREWTAAPDSTAPLNVVFEDTDLIVVDKPSGVPSTPLRSDEKGTVAGAIVARYPECAAIQTTPGDGGLIQRLDIETSGLMIAARDRDVHKRLIELQRSGAIEKSYLALVHCNPEAELPERIKFTLGNIRADGSKVGRQESGRPMSTTVSVEKELGDWLLLRATIHRGFRHQIRAHLAIIGFPLAGDQLYEGPTLPDLNRLFLHAAEVSLKHPATKKPMRLESPLPPELAAVIAKLG